MRQRLARWWLKRANSTVNKDPDLKYRLVFSDSRVYIDAVDASDPETPYPVSEEYYDNAAVFYKGFVNEIGLSSPETAETDGGNVDGEAYPDHVEIPIDGEAVEQVEQVSDVELTTTDAYKKHMTNHVFQQALDPVDPSTLESMGLNKYYIWVALVLLGIIAFGVAAGGLGGGGAAGQVVVP